MYPCSDYTHPHIPNASFVVCILYRCWCSLILREVIINRDNLVTEVTGYGAGKLGFDSGPARATTSRSAPGSTQSPIQWVSQVASVRMTSDLNLVLRSRMSGALRLLCHTSSVWRLKHRDNFTKLITTHRSKIIFPVFRYSPYRKKYFRYMFQIIIGERLEPGQLSRYSDC